MERSLLRVLLTTPPNLSALYEVVQGYGEEWKKVWKWTLRCPVMVEAQVMVEARSWPVVVCLGMSCGHPICLPVNTPPTD